MTWGPKEEWQQELNDVKMEGHALAYGRRGWRVLPVWWPKFAGICACPKGAGCPSTAKHPIIQNWQNEATNNMEQIKTWWSRYPHANIGVATGRISGFSVLDIDNGHGGNDSVQILIKRHGRPDATLVSLTGGGGRHILWKYQDGHKCGQNLKPGLDVRSSGGYILAPPSLHSSGIRYRWHEQGHPRNVELATAPEWANNLLCGVNNHSGNYEPPPEGPIPEGTRNRTLFRHACRFQRLGVTDEELANRTQDLNKKMCQPPLGTREVETIICSALKYQKGT